MVKIDIYFNQNNLVCYSLSPDYKILVERRSDHKIYCSRQNFKITSNDPHFCVRPSPRAWAELVKQHSCDYITLNDKNEGIFEIELESPIRWILLIQREINPAWARPRHFERGFRTSLSSETLSFPVAAFENANHHEFSSFQEMNSVNNHRNLEEVPHP